MSPCQTGNGPFLCAAKGEEPVGAVELSIFPIETMTDFQQMLEEADLPAGPFDFTDAAASQKVLAALQEFVEAYHRNIEQDRQVEYGATTRYVRLETEQLLVGPLPALRYGFTGIREDGSVFERWVSYMTYDGDLLYIVVASYRPEAIPTFRSDEELTQFLPHLTEIMATIGLPLPVSEASVNSVRALRQLDIFRMYGGAPGNPIGQIAEGETVSVTGVSPTGRHWRIPCPVAGPLNCWIPATSDATEPAGG